MAGKRLPFLPPNDEAERPADLFDDPLDTLPMPRGVSKHSAEIEGEAAEPPPPVGYASPPLHTRWKKGGPSPNPHGRPPKRRGGKLFAMMEQMVEIEERGGRRRLTRRAVLDRIVREKAMTESGKWHKLWETRQHIDMQHRQRVADYKAWRASRTSMDKLQEERRRQERANEAFYQWIQRHFAGVHETERKLIEQGVIVRTDDGLKLAEEWREAAARISAGSSADDEPTGLP